MRLSSRERRLCQIQVTLLAALASAVFAPRAPAQEATSPKFPPVLLSTRHEKLCRVKVGDAFPAIELPQLGGEVTKLADLTGQRGTVVLFWAPDRWMANAALADLTALLADKDWPKGVAVVGIAVGQPAGAAQAQLGKANPSFPQLLDQRGDALAKVGKIMLPRIYVLTPQGRVGWFDIEYSEATRRELRQSLAVLTQTDD